MPTTSAYIEIPESQLRRIAQHIDTWLKRNCATHEDFSKQYNTYRDRMFLGEGIAEMHRWRVQAFVNLAHDRPTRNARVPRCREIEIIALVLEISVEELLGMESSPKGDLINVMRDQVTAHKFLELMRSAEPQTKELVSWGEFLPCSLETPAFMEAHHRALYSNDGDVHTWNAVGNDRRNNLFAKGKDRPWAMTHLIFTSDLHRIVHGEREYERIRPEVRKACLETLADILSKPELKIQLIVIDDASQNNAIINLKREVLSGFDSVLTWDDHLAVLRNTLGINYYSRKPRHIGFWRGVLKELRTSTVFDAPEKVIATLRSMARSIGEQREAAAATGSSRRNK